MPRIRKHNRDRYTPVWNETIQNRALSWKARGILVYMLSMPEDWTFRVSDLEKRAPDGKDALRTGIQELEDAGHVYRARSHAEDGTFDGMIWDVYEDPCDNPHNHVLEPIEPQSGNPPMDNPPPENPMLQKKQYRKETDHKLYAASPRASDPPSGEVQEYDMVDETDSEIECQNCGEVFGIRFLKNSAAECEGCGQPFRIRDPHGRVIKRPPQRARRKTSTSPWLKAAVAFVDFAPSLDWGTVPGKQKGDIARTLQDHYGDVYEPGDIAEAIYRLDPDRIYKPEELITPRQTRFIDVLRAELARPSTPRRFIQGNPWEMTAGERLDFWVSWLPALYVLPEDKVAELAAEMGLQKRGDLWYNRNGDLLDPETHSVDWKESPEWKQ